MAKSRACDVCSLRKIRCNGEKPCTPCTKAGFDCSFAKKPLKPGPKGPRLATSSRIRKQLDSIRAHGAVSPNIRNKAPFSSRLVDSTKSSTISDVNDTGYTGNIFALEFVRLYLQNFQEKMYPVWPVIDLPILLSLFRGSPEQAALAFALCAATGAQLRLDEEPDFRYLGKGTPLCDQFAREAEKRRSQYDHWDSATVAGVLIPFFLHAYHTRKQKYRSASLYIREAVTLAQLIGIDRESTYAGLPPDEAHFRRKVFWLLFVTERGHSMQFTLSTILRPVITMPSAEDDEDPELLVGFLTLARLFVAVDGMLTGSEVDDAGQAFSPDMLEALQRQLQKKPEFAPFSKEVQKTDIFVTQQWLRMLLWQLSMKKVSLITSDPGNPLSLTYPADVARDTLAFLSHVSLDSLTAHGPGMELKIFEIASTLLDVINVVPSLSIPNTLVQLAPQDVFHSLSVLLSNLSSGKSSTIALLQRKISETAIALNPVPRLIEVDELDQTSSHNSSLSPPAALSPEFADFSAAQESRSAFAGQESAIDGGGADQPFRIQPFQPVPAVPSLQRHDKSTPDSMPMAYASDSLDSVYDDAALLSVSSPGFTASWGQIS